MGWKLTLVARIQQLVDKIAFKTGRKVVFDGRRILQTVTIAKELGIEKEKAIVVEELRQGVLERMNTEILKDRLTKSLKKYFGLAIKRKPMILPVIT